MPTAERAKIQYEAGQTPYAMAALTDSGDSTTFTGAASPWSGRAGYTPVIRPNGLISGGTITPAASGTDNLVDVAAGSAYINGVLVTWDADTDVAASRGADANIYRITSITATAAGAVAAVAGTAHTASSETRNASGGPPLIAVTSIELGQVRLTTVADAAIASTEIYTVPGLHTERADYPVYEADAYAGSITFASALPAIHTGPLPKAVHASYSVPVYADVQKGSDFKPPENSHTVNSTQIYNRTLGSTRSSLNAGSFTAYLEDGVTDGLVTFVDDVLWFKFFPDQYKSAYIITQGKLGITRSFPAGDNIMATCTIAAEDAATNVNA